MYEILEDFIHILNFFLQLNLIKRINNYEVFYIKHQKKSKKFTLK